MNAKVVNMDFLVPIGNGYYTIETCFVLRIRGAGLERLHDKEYSNIPKLT